MRLTTGAATDVGRVREGNEDAYLVDDATGLVAVADGMGGHRAGEVASATALEALRAAITHGRPLRESMQDANEAVFTKSLTDDELRGMGTTLTAATLVTGGIVLVASLACLAGSATLPMYSAVKAFQHNFAEGLWAELRPHGVDVCCTPLGMTYTPAFQRMGFEYDPASHMLPEDVAREIIANIGNGPVHVVGENNRAAASAVWTIDRRALVEMMSTASLDFASRRKD